MKNTPQSNTSTDRGFFVEPKPGNTFRIATDRSGDWYIWRRMSARSWVTFRRCDSEQDAIRALENLNGPISA